MTLQDRVAVVTGASRGIGKAIALELAARGAAVAVVARSSGTARAPVGGTVEDTVAEIEAAGGTALAVAANLLDDQAFDEIVSTTLGAFGHIDLLINNAASSGPAVLKSTRELSRKDWEVALGVNLLAPFRLTQSCLEHMMRGARIINITSASARHREPDEPGSYGPVYGSSKAALERFTNRLAAELFDEGIAAVTVDPGSTWTELNAWTHEQQGWKRGNHHDVDVPAHAVAYLAETDDVMQYTGRLIIAADLVAQLASDT